MTRPTVIIRFLVVFGGLFLLGGLWTLQGHAQNSGLGMLRIGIDAEGVALGDAKVANTRDAFSTYWNPAGLAAAPKNEAALSHHVWIEGVRNYALSARFRSGQKGGIGLFFNATDSGDLEAREQPGAPEGFFKVQYVNMGIAYSRSIGPLRAGVTAKYLSERIYTQSATGYAFDFGLQADAVNGGVAFGAVLQNLGKMNNLNAQATKLPTTLQMGTAVYLLKLLGIEGVLANSFLVGEASFNLVDNTTQFHAGLAVELQQVLVLRAGYITKDALRALSLGLGLRFSGFHFDYALLPFEQGFGGTGHVLTLAYGW